MLVPSPIETMVAGVTFREDEYPGNLFYIAQKQALADGFLVAHLEREPTNEYDCNAIRILVEGRHIGYVPAHLAKRMATEIDSGATWRANVRGIVVNVENPERPGMRINCWRV